MVTHVINKIPAGSITDSKGNKVLSTVSVQIRTIDLYNPQVLMPGDYDAVENGQDSTLVSFGAIDVQIRDKADPEKRYNIDKKPLPRSTFPFHRTCRQKHLKISPSGITMRFLASEKRSRQ